jgi:transketolase
MKKSDFHSFYKAAIKIKLNTLKLYKSANAGHIASSLSCIDLLTYFWLFKMNENDLFVLSKGHAAAGLYCTLNEKGLISGEKLQTFYQEGTLLAAHPPSSGIKDILFATGSLGHGPSICCGLALGSRLKKDNQQIYCLISDGECNEGSVWEAATFAAHNKLDNLTIIIDKNNLQGFGQTKDVLNMENMAERWQSFNWNVSECDGHDFISINKCVTELQNKANSRPNCIIANTIKGKGVSFMENRLEWHYLPMNDEQYKIAINEITKALDEIL